MRTRRPLLVDSEGARQDLAGIWPAFTDVMSTLALILFVLVLLAYVRNLTYSRRLDAFRQQIAASEQELSSLRVRTAAQNAALAASQRKLLEQQAIVEDSNRRLDDVRSQLQSIAVLRVEVLGKLKDAIVAELGARNDAGADLVRFGDNGNVVINENLVFEYDSYAIKDDAKPLLDTLARALGRVLADDAVRQNIDTILIQGHTDKRGSVALNWDLSAKRSTAVLNYLFGANKTLADPYGSYFAAAAYSKFRPLDDGDSEAAFKLNRRIEISVIPKDANVRKVIDEYAHTIPAALQPSPGSP